MGTKRGDWTLDPEDPRFPNETFELGAAMAKADREAKGLPATVDVTVPAVHQPTRTRSESGPTVLALPLEDSDAA
jgi:hypothetical protein